jgi:zinc transport system ATP-binding protein
MIAIDVEHLGLTLGGVPILKDISFQIPQGQMTALLGANGSGKSTLVKAILGLHRHQHGTIALLGQPLERFAGWDQVGYVPQRASVNLHSTTVGEIVASGALARHPVGWVRARRRVATALEAVGLADSAKELYLHLSGGQQQRVLIARGIVNSPRLVIMDEPFAGVDLATQVQIGQTLTQLGATALVVLHEVEALADHLDRCLVLQAGRLVWDGPVTAASPAGSHETAAPARTPLLTGLEPTWTS